MFDLKKSIELNNVNIEITPEDRIFIKSANQETDVVLINSYSYHPSPIAQIEFQFHISCMAQFLNKFKTKQNHIQTPKRIITI